MSCHELKIRLALWRICQLTAIFPFKASDILGKIKVSTDKKKKFSTFPKEKIDHQKIEFPPSRNVSITDRNNNTESASKIAIVSSPCIFRDQCKSAASCIWEWADGQRVLLLYVAPLEISHSALGPADCVS